jgi:glycerol-3-phosphate dehydrogenase (NAD(P)+)
MGDLMTTCYSPTSRNRTFGERVGRGERPSDVTASMAQIAEGAKSAAPVHDLAARHRLSIPISEEVYRILHEGRAPRESVEALMVRERKDEAEDLA